MKKNILLLFFALLAILTEGFAQNVEMADGLRSSGKIYVVVGVLCIIFIGIVVYLINLDRKLAQLKKEVEQLKN
jgi:CcmD family protein